MSPENENLIAKIKRLYYPGISNSILSDLLGISRSRLAGLYSRHRDSLANCPLGVVTGETKSITDKVRAARTDYPVYSDNVAALHLPLDKLPPTGCKWPYGVRLPYTFCGCPREVATPYCSAHNKIAKGSPTPYE